MTAPKARSAFRGMILVVAALGMALAVASCSDSVNLASDDAGDDQASVSATGGIEGDGSIPTVPSANDDSSIPTVPIEGPIPTIPEGPIQTPSSRAPQTIPPNDGWGGKPPPSYPDFRFGVTPLVTPKSTTVTATGTGCSGQVVQFYFGDGGDGGEGGDNLYRTTPAGDGTFTVAVTAPARPGTFDLTGNCVAIGSSGQTHIGGTFGPIQVTVQ